MFTDDLFVDIAPRERRFSFNMYVKKISEQQNENFLISKQECQF